MASQVTYFHKLRSMLYPSELPYQIQRDTYSATLTVLCAILLQRITHVLCRYIHSATLMVLCRYIHSATLMVLCRYIYSATLTVLCAIHLQRITQVLCRYTLRSTLYVLGLTSRPLVSMFWAYYLGLWFLRSGLIIRAFGVWGLGPGLCFLGFRRSVAKLKALPFSLLSISYGYSLGVDQSSPKEWVMIMVFWLGWFSSGLSWVASAEHGSAHSFLF
ncbi:MAG: hypothetical protein EXX96DRAFT_574074 [Benjaminiella poitrasii]|nr:MAG: hypothetical protein EXX96DRAFT_574074 [Benjaminiella poitrasii]